MAEHQVVEVRRNGRTRKAVTAELGEILAMRPARPRELRHVHPIISSSLTTGHPILFFRREVAR